MFSSVAYAQAAANPPAPTFMDSLPMFIAIFAIFYFFVIRPQGKKLKTHQEFLKNIKRGDEVLTSSGILGKIEGLTDTFVTLEIADGVRIRVLKSQLASSLSATEEKK
ncbi:MAG: preprotein translocase subunit YajC [Bdellovibrionales bacterium]|nr:preprotein translocase subunit YajC [Bdellovibrionales bacterium]